MELISKDEFYEDNLEDVIQMINQYITAVDIEAYKEEGEIIIPLENELADLHENVIASLANLLEEVGWEVTIQEKETEEDVDLLILT